VGGGGPVNTVVDTAVDPQFKHVLRPSINNSGVVAFMAGTIVDKYDTVAVAHSGNIKTIVGPGFSTTGGVLTAATEPAINNKGVVAFRGQPFNLGFTHSGALLLATWSATSTFMASTILARWQTRGK
jgi:hypothetical protein